MQFTDRELFYTDCIWSSRSVRTVRSVKRYLPLTARMKYSKSHKWDAIYGPWILLYGPYLKFMVRTNCTLRNKDICLSQREWNILSPTNEMQFTDRDLFYTDRMWSSRSLQNSTDRNHSLTVRYSAGVLDNPQFWEIILLQPVCYKL